MGGGGEAAGEPRVTELSTHNVAYVQPTTKTSDVNEGRNIPKASHIPPQRCFYRACRHRRVKCPAERHSRVPSQTNSACKPIKHDVAASLKIPRSPPMQFQPVSRSTHAVCTSGTLHIVPLLLTAHNLLIKIPVLALPLSHDSDPLPAQTQVLGMEASQPYLSITCTPQQGAEKSKTCANDVFVYCYRMCFVPCCVQMYAVCFFSD